MGRPHARSPVRRAAYPPDGGRQAGGTAAGSRRQSLRFLIPVRSIPTPFMVPAKGVTHATGRGVAGRGAVFIASDGHHPLSAPIESENNAATKNFLFPRTLAKNKGGRYKNRGCLSPLLWWRRCLRIDLFGTQLVHLKGHIKSAWRRASGAIAQTAAPARPTPSAGCTLRPDCGSCAGSLKD